MLLLPKRNVLFPQKSDTRVELIFFANAVYVNAYLARFVVSLLTCFALKFCFFLKKS